MYSAAKDRYSTLFWKREEKGGPSYSTGKESTYQITGKQTIHYAVQKISLFLKKLSDFIKEMFDSSLTY